VHRHPDPATGVKVSTLLSAAAFAMSRKLLFLDFDGVLHPSICRQDQWFIHLPVLESALAGKECGIVISSSWRFQRSCKDLKALFPKSLVDRLEGATGHPVIGRHARHKEIQEWLAAHPERDWRALDDSGYEFPKPCPELILCDGATGIGERQVKELERWLG
jgi:hypothetical protein